MKAMISMPMGGKTREEIDVVFNRAKAVLEGMGYKVANTRFVLSEGYLAEMGMKNIPLAYLAHSLEIMSMVDMVYFCDGWVHARGCRVEHHTAKSYGIPTMYEGEGTANDE